MDIGYNTDNKARNIVMRTKYYLLTALSGFLLVSCMTYGQQGTAAHASEAVPVNPLVGSWRLISFELRTEAGAVVRPWGEGVSGQVTYTADGYMSGSFMRNARSNFASADVQGGTSAEFEAAMKSYVGYAGPYSINGNHVVHHANVSVFPNWAGTDIDREFGVVGDRLTLSTPPSTFGGQRARGVLVWERLPARSVGAAR
jgi:hypothetical protein